MEGAIITYRLGPVGPKKSGRFVQMIYGGMVSSGGYRYQRRGFLDNIPHWKVIRGVLVVRWEDRREVKRAIREWTTEVECWSIPLTKRQARKLRREGADG